MSELKTVVALWLQRAPEMVQLCQKNNPTRVFLVKRNAHKSLPGVWTLPTVMIRPPEEIRDALARGIDHKLHDVCGDSLKIGSLRLEREGEVSRPDYSDTIRMLLYRGLIRRGFPAANEGLLTTYCDSCWVPEDIAITVLEKSLSHGSLSAALLLSEIGNGTLRKRSLSARGINVWPKEEVAM